MRHAIVSFASLLALLLSVSACGDDKIERGLAVGEEVATPSSDEAMAETQKERDEKLEEGLVDGVRQ